MNILIKSARIIDPKDSKFHQTTQDILIENGLIKEIATAIEAKKDWTIIEKENLHISRGWFDSSVSLGEPGYEDRETIENGLNVAARSGFTAVAVNPNTHPILDTNADISFVKSRAFNKAVDLYPIGALTVKSEGKDLAELFDMKNAGAIAFGDYQRSISNPNLLKIALQYVQSFDGLVFSFPQEDQIAGKGVVNEEVNATFLGLKGIPALAEELQIARDLFILEYTGGKLHIPTISTAKSVSLIREAKAKGLDVSCSVAIHNLLLSDNVLKEFNTHCKVLPPLRTENDLQALRKGLEDGTIDIVTSDHNPIDVERKNVEFDYALDGTIGLESAFGALNSIVDTELAVSLLTGGQERFGIASPGIGVGEKANLSLFNPDIEYEFSEDDIFSASKNSAFLGRQLKGKAYGIIANDQLILND
ncbi:dihydroorotase [Leptobacterium flavescens]|uniref:Dihydroorotase n=1 Tax=Leptobacterium flavescens TaxID=472055 RepID=A0A6P0UKJ4_9FLAO|nr:dihydroorotase [Leptobacterium flavescens]NER13815.1 dihydroorotase [Leptobacterium flavescens]